MIRKAILAPLVAVAMLGVAAAPAGAWWGGGGSSRPATVVDVLVKRSSTDGFDRNGRDYDILIKAATTADLVGALSNPSARLTVFAPDDAAFIRTARSLGYTGWDEQGTWDFLVGALTQLGNGDPIPVLQTVLLYHVAGAKLGVFQVLTAKKIDTLANASFGVRFLQLVDNAPKLPNPYLNLFALNQSANNGVVHGITRVLIPVDIG
jgi:uncharacterized surface protein with fasciclin (FAS1) repeats